MGEIGELNSVLERGLLEVYVPRLSDINENIESLADEPSENLVQLSFGNFMQRIMEDTLSGDSVPLYDEEISNLFIDLADEKDKKLHELRQEQMKHLASVHSVFSQLPNFQNVSVLEVLGIRDELDKYLAKFRSAMYQYSQTIRSMPRDKAFHHEVATFFMTKIEPEIAEIRDIVEQNSFIRKFCTNILNDKSATVVGALGLGVAIAPLPQVMQIPAIAFAGVTTIGKNLINTYNGYLEAGNKSKENALYFYYGVQQRLHNK